MRPARPTKRAAAISALVLLLGVAATPWSPHLQPHVSGGDRALSEQVETLIRNQQSSPGGQQYRHLLVAEIDGGTTATAGWGADLGTEFEIGSITKTFTAALFADAVARGVIAPQERLGDLLDLGDSPAAGLALDELATQRSGLPSLATTPAAIARTYLATLTAGDPYDVPLPTLLDEARAATPTDRGTYRYSNLGVALLGQAVAAAEHTTYRALLQNRLLTPLGLTATSLPNIPAALPADTATGLTASGRHAAPWTLGSYSPAGGIRSTGHDMLRWARAVLGGTAPGTTDGTTNMLDPRAPAGENSRIGWIWQTTVVDGRALTWHNGETGGFHSILVLDRERDRAVLVLSDVAGDGVDELGFDLISGEAAA